MDERLRVRRTRLDRWWWVLALLVLLAFTGWWMTNAETLPQADPTLVVHDTIVEGDSLFVAVWTPPDDGPTLTISSVTATNETGTVTAWVCRDGGIGVTGDLEPYCADVVPAEEAELGPGDQLVLEVSGVSGDTVRSDPATVSYRDGWRTGTEQTGPSIEVRVTG